MTANKEPYALPPEDPALAELDKQVSKDRKASRWMKWALLGVALIACGLAVLSYVYFNQAKDNAEALALQQAQEKQVIAEDARAVLCTAADVEVYDEELCARLDAAADKGAAIAGRDGKDGRDGAPGPRGIPGQDGRDGAPGSPGPEGPAGRDGMDGSNGLNGVSVNGVDGLPGAPGQQGPAGPPGPEGPAGPAGRDGVDGRNGQDGRGIQNMECVGEGNDSYVLVTFTDGTSTSWAGPCRMTPFTIPTTGAAP